MEEKQQKQLKLSILVTLKKSEVLPNGLLVKLNFLLTPNKKRPTKPLISHIR